MKHTLFLVFFFAFCLTVFAQKSTFRKSFGIVPLPTISYHPQTQWAFGANVNLFARFDSLAPTSSLFAEYKRSTLGQSIADLRWNLMLREDRLRFGGVLSYRYFPDVFYGLGVNSLAINKEYFTAESFDLRLRLSKKVRKKHLSGLLFHHFQYAIPRYDSLGLLKNSDLMGANGGYVNGLGLFWTFDSREHAISPHDGWLVEAELMPALRGVLSEFGYLAARLDVRRYVQLAPRHILAFHADVEYLFGDAPFRLYPRLSTGNNLRGYPGARFTDKGMYLLQAEYRLLLWEPKPRWIPALGINVFASAGNVFGQWNDLHLRHLKFSGGLGLRFILDRRNRAVVRFEQGFSPVSSENYLEGGESF